MLETGWREYIGALQTSMSFLQASLEYDHIVAALAHGDTHGTLAGPYGTRELYKR